jgi:hypothetical protein
VARSGGVDKAEQLMKVDTPQGGREEKCSSRPIDGVARPMMRRDLWWPV